MNFITYALIGAYCLYFIQITSKAIKAKEYKKILHGAYIILFLGAIFWYVNYSGWYQDTGDCVAYDNRGCTEFVDN